MGTPKQYIGRSALILQLCSLFWLGQAQTQIPAKYDGFLYNNRPASTDTVIIEAFMDPVCPDSRDSWPPLKQALHYYASSVSFILHPFPLPYHDNSFLTSRALHIVNKLNSSATYSLLEMFFQHQKYCNKQTFNMSRASVVDHITKLVTNVVGSSHYSAVQSGFSDRTTDLATRVSFKHGCSRGVFGTPFFYVNGFPLPDGDSTIDYLKWRSIIDPLVGTNSQELKIERAREKTPITENEIRITSQGRVPSYITYAISLLQEKDANEIVFKAMGRAINKTVTIVELNKRRIVGLHQITSIGSTDITDTWEPLEEGLLPRETTRHVSLMTITLSKEELNTSAVGYQPPLPDEQVKVSPEFDFEGERSPTNQGRGRGQGRGRRGRGRGRGRPRAVAGNGIMEFEDGGFERPRGYARGRGRRRGRGRNFHGREKGEYNGPQMDGQHSAGVYDEEAPVQHQGRGRGRGPRVRGRGFRSNEPSHVTSVDA